MNIDLNDRSQLLMKMLVERYIADGTPVGSKVLSGNSELNVSPATIRNTMKQLEDMGLIISPHTSAGRVPTEQGYRFYVDSILSCQSPLGTDTMSALMQSIEGEVGAKDVAGRVSSLLSEFTQMAGVVMVPKPSVTSLRQIEFMPLDGNQVLVVMVVNNKEVQNRIINTDRQYSRSELDQAANFLNHHYAGKDIGQMGDLIKDDLVQTKQEMNHMMELMIQLSSSVDAGKTGGSEVIVEGQANLIGNSGLDNVDQLKQLFDAFQKKNDIAHLLDRCVKSDGVQIFIGQESGYEPLEGCSVISSPYSVDGETLGVLGVIGPTRMQYEKVVPLVDMTAKMLGIALSKESGS